MDCPLVIYPVGTLGTVDYMAPCECVKLCTYTTCHYRRCGFLITIPSVGATATNTISITGKACGGSFPLVAASTGDLVTNSAVTAGGTYRVTPVVVEGVLRGIVAGI